MELFAALKIIPVIKQKLNKAFEKHSANTPLISIAHLQAIFEKGNLGFSESL